MSRQEQLPATIEGEALSSAISEVIREDEAALRLIDENTVMLADQLNYDGPLTLTGAKDHVRMQMRRTISECLELGKTLLIIKELTPHGGFKEQIEGLGISYSAAKRFMQSTLKFHKRPASRLLESVGTQSKLLELLVLDDDEIKELDDNGSVRGIQLDDIAKMSTVEVRAALRKERDDLAADLDAKDKLIQAQSEQIQKLHKKNSEAERRKANFTDIEEAGYECSPLHEAVGETIIGLKKIEREVARLLHEVGGDIVMEECVTAVLVAARRAVEINREYRLGISDATMLDIVEEDERQAVEFRALGLNAEAPQ